MTFHDIWYWVGFRNVSPSSSLIKIDNRTDIFQVLHYLCTFWALLAMYMYE